MKNNTRKTEQKVWRFDYLQDGSSESLPKSDLKEILSVNEMFGNMTQDEIEKFKRDNNLNELEIEG